MDVFSIVKVEFQKILKKPLSYIMLSVLFVPLFYTYSVLSDAPLLQMTPSGALDFSFGQWNLLGMTGLFQVLFSLVAVNTFSAEIDKGQLKQAVLRQCSKKKIVYAKMLALTLFMLICHVVYLGFSMGCYYCFIIRTEYGTGEFISGAVRLYGTARFIMSGMFTLLDTLLTAGIVFLFSHKLKTGICFMFAVGITTILLILQFFPVVQYLVPAYVGSLLDYGKITPPAAGGLSLMYLTIVVICVEFAARKFERMDLK